VLAGIIHESCPRPAKLLIQYFRNTGEFATGTCKGSAGLPTRHSIAHASESNESHECSAGEHKRNGRGRRIPAPMIISPTIVRHVNQQRVAQIAAYPACLPRENGDSQLDKSKLARPRNVHARRSCPVWSGEQIGSWAEGGEGLILVPFTPSISS